MGINNATSMLKIYFVPLFLLQLLHTQVECLFLGDSCVADERLGTCIPLSECNYLVAEIEYAGRPMPAHMTRKLQELTCGFDEDEPMVCCISGYTSHGTSLPNRGKPTSDDDKTDDIRPNLLDNNDGKNTNSNDVKDGPPDVQGHPNLSLLPTTNCGNIEEDKIVGGNRTRLFQMPWMVLLSYITGRGTELICGGTLINKWYVLTAAHCVSFLGNKRLNGVVIGEHDVSQDPDCMMIEGVELCASKVKNVAIDTVVAHPGYSPQRLNDIALIRLSEPADFTLDNIKPLCLPITPELQREDLAGRSGIVAGWGITEMGLQSSVLLSVALPMFRNRDCTKAYKELVQVNQKQMCAGGVPDQDACIGDSGGPIMFPGNMGPIGVRYVQRGIVSYGSTVCGIGGFPGIYTRIAYYMDWILNNISA